MTELTTEQGQIKKLKRALIMSLIVIVFISGMLAFNMQKLKEYRTISAGTYFTDAECAMMYGKFNFFPLQNCTADITDNCLNDTNSGLFR